MLLFALPPFLLLNIGMSAQVLRDIPFYATFFGFYELSCRYLRATTKWNDTSVYFVSGGLAGQVNLFLKNIPHLNPIPYKVLTKQYFLQ